VAFKVKVDFAESFVLFIVTPFRRLIVAFGCTIRIEETFEPLASLSWELATLAFFAVFKVLIKDFFWMDIS
jgi:hypothetical protein